MRLREFSTADFVSSYLAKFFLGLGLGLLLPNAWGVWGWGAMLFALLIGFRAEVKFWKSRN